MAPNELAEVFGQEYFEAAPEPPRAPQVVPEGMYMIGHLAKALGKKRRTILLWIEKGWLPEAPARTTGPSYVNKLGKHTTNAKRLWPAIEINAIVEIAEQEGVTGPYGVKGIGGMAGTNFVLRVQDALRELRA